MRRAVCKRCVYVGDTFVNVQLIREGVAAATCTTN